MWCLVYTSCLFVASCLVEVKCEGDDDGYTIPPLKLEAYSPKGFKAALPDRPKTGYFVFNGHVNKDIHLLEPGTLSGEITDPENGFWTFYDPNLQLKVGDNISYWVFVQNNDLGFRKEDAHWRVDKLLQDCEATFSQITLKEDGRLCKDTVVLEEHFENIDSSNWLIHQYIPDLPDLEFVSYENDSEVCYVKDKSLYIKPKIRSNVTGILDLSDGCTSDIPAECRLVSLVSPYYLPPIISGKLSSKFEVQYGKIEIKVRLPAGDWIYPELYLQSVNNPSYKIWIAYVRGNENLVDLQGIDYGSTLLFGGPVFDSEEPKRSENLSSKRSDTPYTKDAHKFAVIWTPAYIKLLVDDQEFGYLQGHNFHDKAKLVLGIGVGGVNDFPDGFTSNRKRKPWVNYDRFQVKNFSNAKNEWSRTWSEDGTVLKVESVTIWAM